MVIAATATNAIAATRARDEAMATKKNHHHRDTESERHTTTRERRGQEKRDKRDKRSRGLVFIVARPLAALLLLVGGTEIAKVRKCGEQTEHRFQPKSNVFRVLHKL